MFEYDNNSQSNKNIKVISVFHFKVINENLLLLEMLQFEQFKVKTKHHEAIVGKFLWTYKKKTCNTVLSESKPMLCIGFFYPTPTSDAQLNHVLHRTTNLWIQTRAYWYGTISFETFIETDISCCVPRFPFIASLLAVTKLMTAKIHSHYVKESESEILERSELESDILRCLFHIDVHALYSLKAGCSPCFVQWCSLGSFYHLNFRKWPFSTAVRHHES